MESSFESKPRVCFEFEVEKVIGVSNDGSYHVQWAPAWVSGFHLVGCEHLIQEFIQQQAQEDIRSDPESQLEMPDEQRELPDAPSDMSDVQSKMAVIKSEMVHELSDMSDLQSEMSHIKSEMSHLQGEMADVQCEILDTHSEMPGLQSEMRDVQPEMVDRDCVGQEMASNEPNVCLVQSSTLPATVKKERDDLEMDSCTLTGHLNDAYSLPPTSLRNTPTLNDELPETVQGCSKKLVEPQMESEFSGVRQYTDDLSDGTNPIAKLMCLVCDKQFSYESELARHVKGHSSEELYECSRCKRTFTQRSLLTAHIRWVHSNEPMYSCDRCEKSFKTRAHLKQHMRTHASGKTFTCDHCGRLFSVESYLKKHLKSHIKEKRFTCDHCGESFAWKSNLDNHLTTHV